MQNKKVLGRGLGNLLDSSNKIEQEKQGIIEIDASQIENNSTNPRKHFNENLIIELSKTIQSVGLLHPILVRKCSDNSYAIISGERRFRALKLLQIQKIPCIVKKISEKENLEIALIENIQREQLDTIEEANVYKELMQKYNFTQEQIAQRVGKNRSSIANKLRMLSLPDSIKFLIANGMLSEGQARPLASLNNTMAQKTLSKEIVNKNYNARKIEEMVKNYKQYGVFIKKSNSPSLKRSDSNIATLEKEIEENLKTRVRIKHNAKKLSGSIVIDYFDLEHLEEIMQKIS